MALPYKPLTEADIDRLRCLPAGEHEFYVSEVAQTKSKGGIDKNGNVKKIYDMLAITLKIIIPTGGERAVKDWVLIVPDEDPMGFKLRHFAATCNLLDKYEAGVLEAYDFAGKHGVVKLAMQDFTDQKTGEVKKINAVVDYIKPKLQMVSNNFDAGKPFDDDIPFI
jgi:hypothetical protein